jgi:ABC transporter with metal-binding/Fe-S-binding domain ATP-binding protein
LKKLAVLYSGGKDSTFATYSAVKEGHCIVCLLSVIPKDEESYMFHYPNIALTSLQAKAMGLPHLSVRSEGAKEAEISDLRKLVMRAQTRFQIDGLCSGGIASNYQKIRIERVCNELGLESVSPLWGFDQEKYLYSIITNNFDVVVVAVSALGLNESWLGRRLDIDAVREIIALSQKFRFNASFEGGEGETLVTDCPLFRKKLVINGSRKVWRGSSGYLIITRARLQKKKTGE